MLEQVSDGGLIRVMLLLTEEQLKALDRHARRAALSRSSYVRVRFDQIFRPEDPQPLVLEQEAA